MDSEAFPTSFAPLFLSFQRKRASQLPPAQTQRPGAVRQVVTDERNGTDRKSICRWVRFFFFKFALQSHFGQFSKCQVWVFSPFFPLPCSPLLCFPWCVLFLLAWVLRREKAIGFISSLKNEVGPRWRGDEVTKSHLSFSMRHNELLEAGL